MKNRKSLLLVFVTLSLTSSGACASIPTSTTKRYTQLCQSYAGQDIKSLIDEWGYPYSTLTVANGRKVYVYREMVDPYSIDVTEFPALLDYPPFIRQPKITGDVTGGFYLGENCVSYFETSKYDKIVKVFWKGDCRARERE